MRSELTLNKLFQESVERYRGREFLQVKTESQWQRLTYYDVADRVRDLAMGLYGLGLRAGDRLAIWSENRPEWNVADLATLAIGAVDVPVYTTQAHDQIEYILSDSGARAIFVSSSFQSAALEIKKACPNLEFIISLDPVVSNGPPTLATAKPVVQHEPEPRPGTPEGGLQSAKAYRDVEMPGEYQDWGALL